MERGKERENGRVNFYDSLFQLFFQCSPKTDLKKVPLSLSLSLFRFCFCFFYFFDFVFFSLIYASYISFSLNFFPTFTSTFSFTLFLWGERKECFSSNGLGVLERASNLTDSSRLERKNVGRKNDCKVKFCKTRIKREKRVI